VSVAAGVAEYLRNDIGNRHALTIGHPGVSINVGLR
jgi:hypothetical protein